MFSPVDEDTRQQRMEPMELSWMNIDVCQSCNDSKAIIFDTERVYLHILKEAGSRAECTDAVLEFYSKYRFIYYYWLDKHLGLKNKFRH